MGSVWEIVATAGGEVSRPDNVANQLLKAFYRQGKPAHSTNLFANFGHLVHRHIQDEGGR